VPAAFARSLKWGLGALALSALAGLAAVALWACRSLPEWSGALSAPGLERPVDIVRDRYGVPHVFAQTEADAYFGLGYAHAQDRLWQLELDRRLASGRLAEVFGRDALPRDRLFRTLGLRRAAEQSLPYLDAVTRAALDGYVRGVNAFLQSDPPLPVEFGMFGLRPEPWTPLDSLVWLKMLAWMLASNLDAELARARLSERLGPRELAEFFAPYPGEPPVVLQGPVEGLGWLPPALGGATGALVPPSGAPNLGLGSNNWVLDGRRTQSGKPLLANDPHLALTSPSIWYLAHLHAPGLDVVGATLPSVPGVILGHNPAVAWAFTNTGSDTQDVFVERLVPGDPSRYQTPEGTLAFDVVRELIHVKGAADEVLDVRISRHGPVLSGGYDPATQVTGAGHVLALAWTALAPDDGTLDFVTRAAHAQNADELRQAARHLDSPPQNVVYADTSGQIGFVAAGRVPLRRPSGVQHGLMPAPGWDGRSDWDGFLAFEQLPNVQNPETGAIVTANQKITPPDYPYWLSADWSDPYRAQRIQGLLEAVDKHSVATFGAMQLDVRSGSAVVVLPLLLSAMTEEGARLTPTERQLLDRLGSWNLEMRKEALEPLLFSAWLRQLQGAIYEDELGAAFRDAFAERIDFVDNVLSDRGGQSRWCDDVRTPASETCPERVARAFRDAVRQLTERYGDDVSEWSWGAAHVARARHFPMTKVPLLRDLFDLVVASDGGTNTVNVGAYAVDDDAAPFESRHAAGYRAVYDLGDLDASRFAINGGQSGHVLSSHYRDGLEPWQRGELVPMLTRRASVEQGSLGTLRITPRP
jgi:penicillin amidase